MEAVAPKSQAAEPAEKKEAQAAAGKKRFLVLGVLAVLVAIAAISYKLATAHEEETDDAQIEADVVPLAARVGGAIEKVAVKDNQQVKAGQLILVLDDADYAAKVAQAEAQLATAEANAIAADAQVQVAEASAKGGFSTAQAAVSGSSVGVSSAEAEIAAANAAVLRAKAEQRKAQLDLARDRQLRRANAIPQQQLDNAEVGVDAANAGLAQAEAQLRAAQEAKAVAQSRVREAQGRLNQTQPVEQQVAAAHAQDDLAHARVKAAQAQLTLAKNQLGYTHVYAPSDGMISKLDVYEGQLIQPGQAIAELVPDEAYVVANFKETQITEMKAGERAEITVDAYPGVHLRGKVLSLSGGTGARFSLLPPDNASGNFVKVVQRVPVRIALIDPPKDLPLRAGLSADVTVYTHSRTSGEQAER